MALENRLKEYRARLGINQADMGKLAGVSRQTISLIERGDYSPSVTLALKLAKIIHWGEFYSSYWAWDECISFGCT